MRTTITLLAMLLAGALSHSVSAQTTAHQETLNITVTTPGTLGDLVLAQTENFGDVKNFTVSGRLNDDDLYTVCKRMTSIVTLDMIGADVDAMPRYGFSEQKNLKTVVLPKTLTEISDGLFEGCEKLYNITMPQSLKKIDNVAFRNCVSLTSVYLPETVEELSSNVFEKDTSLVSVRMPARMTAWGGSVFSSCKHLRSITVPEGIEEIGGSTFSGCKDLSSVTLPSTLKTLSDYAFGGCENLKSIQLPEGLTDIKRTAFSYCHGLTEIDLPSTTRLVYEQAFYPCNNLHVVRCHAIDPPVFGGTSAMGGYADNNQFTAALFVPAPSLNAYKQTVGWDKHDIKALSSLPKSLIFYADMTLPLPASLPADYKPTMRLEKALLSGKGSYPAVTVNGTTTLSLSDYHAFYDMRYYDGNSAYSGLNINKLFGSLISNAPIRSDKVSLTFIVNAYSGKNGGSGTYWNFISLPFNARVAEMELALGSDYVIYEYSGAKRAAAEFDDTWQRVPANGTLLAGKGYIMKCSEQHEQVTFHAIDDNHKNDIFGSAEAVVPLEEYTAEDKHNRSWNFIGNPYPAYFDTRLMQYDGPFVVWNRFYRQYETYTPYDDTYILDPGEGFFLQRPLKQPSVAFSLEGRQGSKTVIERPATEARRMAAAGQRTVYNLTLNGGADRTRFVLNAQATRGYDDGRDATKFASLDPQVPQLYTLEGGARYSINERPLADGIISLGLQVDNAGEYTLALTASPSAETAWLVDHETGQRTQLSEEGYTFHSEAGTYNHRFTIEVGDAVTEIKNINVNDHADSYYDLQGRRIDSSLFTLHSSLLKRGIYIIGGKKYVMK